MLDGNKVVSGDNPLMVVTIDALWPVPSIFPGFVGQIVGGKRLAGKDIPAMALIPKHLYNRVIIGVNGCKRNKLRVKPLTDRR